MTNNNFVKKQRKNFKKKNYFQIRTFMKILQTETSQN